jgi:integrase
MGRQSKHREKVPGVRIWKRKGEGPGARWKMTFVDPSTRKQKCRTGSTEYDLTVEKAKKIARGIDRVRLGLAQPIDERYDDEDAKGPATHLKDWQRSMEAAGRDAKHVKQFYQYVRDVLLGTPSDVPTAGRGRHKNRPSIKMTGLGIARMSAIVASKVYEQIGAIKAERSATTANRYLNAINAFLNWGVRDGRWARNICEHLMKFNVDEDRRVTRRAIEAVEFARLVEVTEAQDSPVVAGLTGSERGRLYRFAVASGLRRNEVRHVRVCDLELGPSKWGVWTRANISRKNKKRRFVPIPVELGEELADAVRDKGPEEMALKCPSNTARMLKADLERAGIPYKTTSGTFDFHAVRHQCGALLVSAGLNVKAVQQHMRHSRSQMTLDNYGHLLESDRNLTAHSLPNFPPREARRNARRQGGIECPQASADDRVKNEEPAFSGEKAGSGEWSHGESNPDLLNAIQPSSR